MNHIFVYVNSFSLKRKKTGKALKSKIHLPELIPLEKKTSICSSDFLKNGGKTWYIKRKEERPGDGKKGTRFNQELVLFTRKPQH